MDIDSLNFFYERKYTLQDMIELVEKKEITKEQFKWITGYSFDGYNKKQVT